MINKTCEIKSVNDRTVIFRASDPTPDRDNDIILTDGWKLDNFKQSGSILYGHDPSRFPVGAVKDAYAENNELLVVADFPKGASPDTDIAYSLIKAGVLKGVSVGFVSDDWEQREDGRGKIFKSQELLELSLTPVPANPNAMAIVKEYGKEGMKFVDMKKMVFEIDEDLDEEEYEKIRKQVEQIIYRTKEPEQEETKDVEPEPSKEDIKATKFLELVKQLKS